MNKILEKHFIDKYPKIFRDMYGPMNETTMHWGISTGKGWFILLDVLCWNIQSHIDSQNKYRQEGEPEVLQLIAHQIKEKFGLLRFYKEGGDEYCDGLISMAEEMSRHICEHCGASGINVGCTKGWIQHLCTKCALEEKRPITQNEDYQKLLNQVEISNE